MTDEIRYIVTWSDPERRHDLIARKLGKGNFVYAIIVCPHYEKSLIRLGASRHLTKRLRGYPIMDFIADVFVSYHVVSEEFRKAITPLLVSYFSDERNHDRRPSFLKGRKPDDCVQSELRSIEYKVERLLLDQYKKRHKRLPPGNPRTGSYREYLENVTIEERGYIRILDMPCASPAPIRLEGEQLVRLLW